MKILVAYKRVVDYNVRIQVKPDGSGVVTDGVKLSANPFDEIALEEALRLRDKGIATEVVVATIAPADAQAHLRNGLAMGANRAVHVVCDQAIQPLTAARALLKLVEKEQPDIVILGKQAIDDDANQTDLKIQPKLRLLNRHLPKCSLNQRLNVQALVPQCEFRNRSWVDRPHH